MAWPGRRRLRAPAPGQYHARSLNRHSGLRHLPPPRLCLACMSAVDSCWVLTPSERAAAANAGDDVSARPAANSGWSAALTRAVLTCSSSAALEPTALEPPGFCMACVPSDRLCLACMSAVDSCWVLTPSERAAA